MLHVSTYVHVENCVYTCLLCLTSSHWQPASGWLSVNSSKSFRISPCSSPIILEVVCCVGRIAAFAAADFQMPVCWSRSGEHCKVAQRCTNFPEIWEPCQCSCHQKGDVKQGHYQGHTLQNSVAMVTWLPGIVHPWTSPCPVCFIKGTALFLVSCLPVTKWSWHMLGIVTVQNYGRMFWHFASERIFSHQNIVVLWHYVKLYSQFIVIQLQPLLAIRYNEIRASSLMWY
jgi:hypothetical protein